MRPAHGERHRHSYAFPRTIQRLVDAEFPAQRSPRVDALVVVPVDYSESQTEGGDTYIIVAGRPAGRLADWSGQDTPASLDHCSNLRLHRTAVRTTGRESMS